jgi:uncharacterized membrane protein YdjX (TVP38/TMEM64 family)
VKLKWLATGVGVIVVALVVWSVWDHQAVMGWIARARPLQFFSLMALLPAIGVPITPLFVLAGASFGMKLGVAGSLAALAVNLAGCFWVARAIRPQVESLLRRFGVRLPKVERSVKRPVRFVIAVKLAPVLPGFVKNYALGLSGVPFGLYFGLSMVISGFYGVLLVVLGESLLAHNRGRAFWAGVAVAALTLMLWLRRRDDRASRSIETTPEK